MNTHSTSTRMWLAHDDDNHVVVLYDAHDDTPKKEAREIASFIRRGLTVRRIIDEDGARRAWDTTLSESAMREIVSPPEYSPDEGSAARIAERIVR